MIGRVQPQFNLKVGLGRDEDVNGRATRPNTGDCSHENRRSNGEESNTAAIQILEMSLSQRSDTLTNIRGKFANLRKILQLFQGPRGCMVSETRSNAKERRS